MESSATTAVRTDTTGTPECDQLLKIAAPEVYRKNAFRILGLPIDTSLREAAKEVNRRQMLAELGQRETETRSRLEIRPAPAIDDLRAAEAALHDPAQRLVHELFWFWPLDPLSGHSDPALQAIQAGDLKSAASFWDAARKDAGAQGTRPAIAKHNTAVRWHFQVLDIESATDGKCWDDTQADNVRKTWVAALAYWKDSLQSDAIWNALFARVIAFNDERASLEFVESMRKTAGRALLKINATLALRYVDLNASTAALGHLTLLLDSPFRAGNSSAVDEFLVAPIKERVRQRIRDSESGRTSDPSQAKDIAHRLIAKFSVYLPLFIRLTAGRDAYDLAGLSDEVVSECLACVVAYYDATRDGPASLTLLETILPLARSEAIRGRVEENIAIAKSNLVSEKFAPLREALNAIEESKETPYNRLAEFGRSIEPLITNLGTTLLIPGPAQDLVSDRIAGLLRGISVDAWNIAKDERTAFDALGRADKFARSLEIKAQLAADRAVLVRVYAEERRQRQAKKNKKYAWFAGIGVAVAIVIGLNVNDSSPPHEAPQAAPPAEAASPDTSRGPTTDSTRTFRVPQYMVEELNQERAAAEAAQREAADLDAQLAAARKELDAKQAASQAAKTELDDFRERLKQARILVSSHDDAAVSRFNKEVARYNRMVTQVHRKIVAADALVDPYNALLGRAKAKADEADRLVDAYNQKLAQVGH